jgi:hypothetical protein
MLKNLFANRKIFVLIIAVILLILGIVVVVALKQDLKEAGNSGVSSETDKDVDGAQEKDEPYNGEGLEIMEEEDETVGSVDVPNDWDGTSGDSNDKTQSNEVDKEDADDKGDSDDEEQSDEDILIDDKVWGEPS